MLLRITTLHEDAGSMIARSLKVACLLLCLRLFRSRRYLIAKGSRLLKKYQFALAVGGCDADKTRNRNPAKPPAHPVRLSGHFDPLPHYSHRRFDICVEAEEVARIVLVLQSHEPLVVRPIGCPHFVFAFLTEVVDVHTAGREWPHHVP